jgi:hypothetical protein
MYSNLAIAQFFKHNPPVVKVFITRTLDRIRRLVRLEMIAIFGDFRRQHKA